MHFLDMDLLVPTISAKIFSPIVIGDKPLLGDGSMQQYPLTLNHSCINIEHIEYQRSTKDGGLGQNRAFDYNIFLNNFFGYPYIKWFLVLQLFLTSVGWVDLTSKSSLVSVHANRPLFYN